MSVNMDNDVVVVISCVALFHEKGRAEIRFFVRRNFGHNFHGKSPLRKQLLRTVLFNSSIRPCKKNMFLVRISIKKRAGGRGFLLSIIPIACFFTHYYLPPGIRWSS